MVEDKPHYIGHRMRLKDRFRKGGIETLADYELVEVILSYAVARKDLKPLAKHLLSEFGSFQGILDTPLDRLTSVKGMGDHTALLFKVIKGAMEWYLRERIYKKPVISSPQALEEYCRASMSGRQEEVFRVLFLNARNEVMADEILQEGTVD